MNSWNQVMKSWDDVIYSCVEFLNLCNEIIQSLDECYIIFDLKVWKNGKWIKINRRKKVFGW